MRKCRHKPPTVRVDRNSKARDSQFFRGVCEFGNCLEFVCIVCGCNSGGGFGPMDCPCDDMVGFHDMRRKPHVEVKPSLSARRRRRTRRSK